MRVCYYELLGVDVRASGDEIKKAYRKRCLLWHPDKAKDLPDEASTRRRFQELQEAYECLADPNERAWYDGHRHQFLAGKDVEEAGGRATGDESGCVNLWPYFSRSSYAQSTGESRAGETRSETRSESKAESSRFYEVYADVFERVDAEDLKWSATRTRAFPSFGSATSSWAEVSEFYNAWGSFAATTAFTHANKWQLRDAPNREIRRVMEAENKKTCAKARREYSELVRQLVSFVRKRDPRVLAHVQATARAAAEERERGEAAREEERQRQWKLRQEARDREMERLQEMELEMRALRAQGQGEPLTDEEGERSGEEGEKGEKGAKGGKGGRVENDGKKEKIACAACKKGFKSRAQLIEHFKTNKHIKKCKELSLPVVPPGQGFEDPPTTSMDVKDDEGGDDKHNDKQGEETSEQGEEKSDKEQERSQDEGREKRVDRSTSTDMDINKDEAPCPPRQTTVEEKVPCPPGQTTVEEKAKPEGKPRRRAKKSGEGPNPLTCMACRTAFKSTNELFDHLRREPSHAAPKVAVEAAKKKKAQEVAGSAQRKAKGRS